MPSAANMKLDKQVPSENSLNDNNSTPLRQAITVMEHKVRNMEKRKSKLDTYRELQNSGKELNTDQKTSLAKYNEVTHTIDFTKELRKQFVAIAVSSEKEAKKQVKKESAAKTQADLARVREILLVQDALIQMGTESVREDFLLGRNGAAQLTENDLKLLDELYPLVTPKHEVGNPSAFTNEVQTSAEHLLAVVDGKQKEFFGGTYSQVKEILGKIHESGYFDQAPSYEYPNNEPQNNEIVENNLTNDNNIQLAANDLSPQQQPPLPQVQPPIEVLPTMEVLPSNANIPQQLPPIEQNLQPEPAPALFYQQQPPTLPPPQPPRPLTEMLGTGSFFFLQESEIDPPPEQIPSQTFTNQNFVGGPPPQPQAIPIPALYPNIPQQPPQQSNVHQPQQQQQQNIGGGKPIVMNTTNMINNNNINKNGIEDKQKQLADNSHLSNNNNNNNNHNFNNNNNKHGNGNRSGKSNQSYYQNNNGYNNNNGRPRQSRNGPRTGNRHN